MKETVDFLSLFHLAIFLFARFSYSSEGLKDISVVFATKMLSFIEVGKVVRPCFCDKFLFHPSLV